MRTRHAVSFWLGFVWILLCAPGVALGNPINPLHPFPPFPPTLVAIFLEAVVVMLIVKRAMPGLRLARFTLLWYGVNLVSVYFVMLKLIPALVERFYPSIVKARHSRPAFCWRLPSFSSKACC